MKYDRLQRRLWRVHRRHARIYVRCLTCGGPAEELQISAMVYCAVCGASIPFDQPAYQARVYAVHGPRDLVYAAAARCICGGGYAKRHGDVWWQCEYVLRAEGQIALGNTAAIFALRWGQVHSRAIEGYPHNRIVSEYAPDAHGRTTRPPIPVLPLDVDLIERIANEQRAGLDLLAHTDGPQTAQEGT